MRGGIPLSARLFALASMISRSTHKDVVSAANNVNNRPIFNTGSGTDQRKRRKKNKFKHRSGRV